MRGRTMKHLEPYMPGVQVKALGFLMVPSWKYGRSLTFLCPRAYYEAGSVRVARVHGVSVASIAVGRFCSTHVIMSQRKGWRAC